MNILKRIFFSGFCARWGSGVSCNVFLAGQGPLGRPSAKRGSKWLKCVRFLRKDWSTYLIDANAVVPEREVPVPLTDNSTKSPEVPPSTVLRVAVTVNALAPVTAIA